MVPGLACAAAALLVASPFLPWFATDIGPPFAAASSSGWEATDVARIVLFLGVLVLAANAALVLDALERVVLEDRTALVLAWSATGLACGAVLLIAYRLVVLPEPAEFLSRDFGLYVAAAAAVASAALSAAGILARAPVVPRR